MMSSIRCAGSGDKDGLLVDLRLQAADLAVAWAYAAAHPGEIDEQIRENEEA
jgi:hypothetical protein